MEHLTGGAPALYPLDGVPRATIDVDPPTNSVGVRVEWDGIDVPELAEYDHISCSVVLVAGAPWAEMRVSGRELIPDGYRLLLAVLDRVLNEGHSFADSVAETLERFDAVLDEIHGLSLERELGLWGELAVLKALLLSSDAATTLEAWKGPYGGEHDFTLPGGDLEVKTTSMEKRVHWFSDPSQLRPTIGRRLWILSIQVTPSSGEGAKTLAQSVGEVRARFTSSLGGALEDALSASGWHDGRDALYRRRWRLRTLPVGFEVTDSFPAVTTTMLESNAFPVERLVELRQRIDLDGLATSADSPAGTLEFGEDFHE
jgi:hypothetical protein